MNIPKLIISVFCSISFCLSSIYAPVSIYGTSLLAPPFLSGTFESKLLDMDNTVIVTGGAGYIGSHTVRELLTQGYDVVIIDNLVKGRRFAIERNQQFARELGRTCIFENVDLGHPVSLKKTLHKYKHALTVIHFAAFIEVGESVDHPALFYQNNIINTMHLLDAMVEAEIGRIIFSSSAAVYGKPKSIPITETDPQLPINPYGYTKLVMEKLIRFYEKKYGIEWVALRYFNASGAHLKCHLGEAHNPESHLIPLVIHNIARGNKPVIFGDDYDTDDGTGIRDYIHVADLAKAHVLALEAKKTKINRVFNLGTGKGFSVKQIINAIIQKLGVEIQAEIKDRRPGDADKLIAVADAFHEATGWEPKNSDVETVIRTAIEWYKNMPEEALEEKPLPSYIEEDLVTSVSQELMSNCVISQGLKYEIIQRLSVAIRYRDMKKILKQFKRNNVLADWDDVPDINNREQILNVLDRIIGNSSPCAIPSAVTCKSLIFSQ